DLPGQVAVPDAMALLLDASAFRQRPHPLEHVARRLFLDLRADQSPAELHGPIEARGATVLDPPQALDELRAGQVALLDLQRGDGLCRLGGRREQALALDLLRRASPPPQALRRALDVVPERGRGRAAPGRAEGREGLVRHRAQATRDREQAGPRGVLAGATHA